MAVISEKVRDMPVDLRSMPRLQRLGDDPVFDILGSAVPFDFVSISGLDLDNYRIGSFRTVVSTFPPAFTEAYGEEGLFRTDPLVLSRDTGMLLVREADAYRQYPAPHRLKYLLRTFEIGNRLAIYLRRSDRAYGAVVFSRIDSDFSDNEAAFLAVIAPALHERVMGPLMERFAATQIGLSVGEIECLSMIGRGMTSEEAASNSRFSKDTVDSYIKSAMKKLNATNRAHAIAEAVRRRLID